MSKKKKSPAVTTCPFMHRSYGEPQFCHGEECMFWDADNNTCSPLVFFENGVKFFEFFLANSFMSESFKEKLAEGYKKSKGKKK